MFYQYNNNITDSQSLFNIIEFIVGKFDTAVGTAHV